MAEAYNLTWDEGSDLDISITYKSGPAGAETPVDLSLHSLRMDVATTGGKIITVLNDEAIADADPFTDGAQPDSTYEVTMNAAGEILIVLDRDLTLPGGPFYKYISANPPVTTFDYDIFLRDAADKQKKIIYGTISVTKSVTKWP